MEWISVNDRLPPDGSEYLCRYKSGSHQVLMCTEGRFNVFRKANGTLYVKNEIRDVEYWMPIPDIKEGS